MGGWSQSWFGGWMLILHFNVYASHLGSCWNADLKSIDLVVGTRCRISGVFLRNSDRQTVCHLAVRESHGECVTCIWKVFETPKCKQACVPFGSPAPTWTPSKLSFLNWGGREGQRAFRWHWVLGRWSICYLSGWSKSSFGFFRKVLWTNPNEVFGQPNTWSHFIAKFLRKILLLLW